jgi:hypothetical protein
MLSTPINPQTVVSSPCPDLPEFKGQTLGDLIKYNVNTLVPMYYDCQAKHEAYRSR